MASEVRCIVLACVFAVASLPGCSGDEHGRLSVHGTVTRGPKALSRGSISFLPADASQAPSATTGVVDGNYQFTGDAGPVPGTYKVVITPHVGKPTPSQSHALAGSAPLLEPWSSETQVSGESLKLDFDIAAKK
jgi:hypothetical protein